MLLFQHCCWTLPTVLFFSLKFLMCLIYFCIITWKLLLSVFGHTIMCTGLFDLFKHFIYITFVIQICVYTPLFFSDVLKCLSHYKSNWKFSPLLFPTQKKSGIKHGFKQNRWMLYTFYFIGDSVKNSQMLFLDLYYKLCQQQRNTSLRIN